MKARFTQHPQRHPALTWDEVLAKLGGNPAALQENKPQGSVEQMAAEMGIALLDEAQYRALQALGEFDLKTSNWLATPPDVRALGGALFGDRRYGRVFTYHNGVQSHYAARGFRRLLRV